MARNALLRIPFKLDRGTQQTKSGGYVPQFDGMRALAVMVVVLSHLGFPLAHGGKGGVLVFFVLSGYLITTVLVREASIAGKISFKAFYARRALRLLPALLAVTAVTSAYACVTNSSNASQKTLQSIPGVLLYVNNWQQVIFGSDSAGYFNHFWTLSVEEQFYIAWPIILVLVYRWRGLATVGWIAVLGSVITMAVKTTLWDGSIGRQAGTDFAADGLLLGCGLAIFLASGSAKLDAMFRYMFWVGVLGILGAVTMGRSGGAGDPGGYELFGKLWWPVAVIGAAITVGAIARGVSPRWVDVVLGCKPLVFIGCISYGIYLWHILVIGANPFGNPILEALFVLCVTIVVASLSWFTIERPFLTLKRRFQIQPPDPSLRLGGVVDHQGI